MYSNEPIYRSLHNELSSRIYSDEKTISRRTITNALKSVRAANKGLKKLDRIEIVCVYHYNRGYIYIPVYCLIGCLECAKYSQSPIFYIDGEYLIIQDGSFSAQWPIYTALPNDVRFYKYAN